MSFEVLVDADTGDEILYFTRRKRPYLYLRDADTKAFIKRLTGVELRYFGVVDYSKERAKTGNPLYIDVVVATPLSPEIFEERDTYEVKCMDKADDVTGRNFGGYVVEELLEDAGVEIGSEIRNDLKRTETVLRRKKLIQVETPKVGWCYWSVVWKHKPEDEPRSISGVETL